MAFIAQTLTHGDKVYTTTILNGASSAEINLGRNSRFLVTTTGAYHIKFGPASLADAAATDTYFPSGSVAVWDLGRAHESIKLFNDSGSTITYWVTVLST